ncbi:precorrin-6y C5,15-methyltransferase (decarboxylating) subunit CbiE [uncultured Ilyobacter sp.]|jgi:cobalt-precorrin-7 (C5)-methyltransferase|uniref:precorrin-6y C5,15-methyltransferase (decarboxylating) subunit CbiE n=1 Tax=uncultured Ilyobacter sp. TaxID=544433 RepID=UPI002AA8D444|nr:precorrin-6y C5,15-methyltransferase (decarboxylating) subunit CbiE [uncultured Ilyobacter sp.]
MKIDVLGLGPGNRDYILPEVEKRIKSSDLVVGGKRNIEGISDLTAGKEIAYIDRHLKELVQSMKDKMSEKKIAVVLSGDTGFYSMLGYLRKNFEMSELDVVPGISSMQYFFAKIGEQWHDAVIKSVHGREFDYIEALKTSGKVGLLTDDINTPQEIARKVWEAGIEATVYVGENLSYSDECITVGKAEEIKSIQKKFDLNVVIIKGEES